MTARDQLMGEVIELRYVLFAVGRVNLPVNLEKERDDLLVQDEVAERHGAKSFYRQKLAIMGIDNQVADLLHKGDETKLATDVIEPSRHITVKF
ncbi:hypothetical protein PsorP6_017767 [Peronosclerospora sorghi]|uniref:Uncharacterized protein n=1 Tax=Peronosclerospora sorghi TaxID=230839 RepID=A0ACC0WNJ5_9STRA|nr:hypothetical protein PsorP6_017767 [Peronosclerospora sorghi]